GAGGALAALCRMTDGLNWAGHEFLKPTIWVSPSRVVALGRNVTIRCEGQDLGMEFVLCKAGHPNQQVQSVVPEGKMAEFPIASVGQEDGGSYTCYYHSITDQSRWSFPSNPVEIIVGEPSYPKPNISGIPSRGVSVGEAMAIWCRRQRQGVRFVLNKEGRHFPPVDSDGFGAVFPISNVSREDGGSYSYTRGGVCVSPSNSCLCVNAELPAPGPSISVSPSRVIAPGGAVTIRCPCEARRLFLYKDGIEIQELDAAGGGGQFTIPSARREDGGAYTCRSRSTSEPPNWSDPSDILIYPKPSISLRPSGRVTLGRAVTVQCRGRHQNAMFLLYKDGNLNALQDVELAGNLAEFSFRNVSRRDAGSYSCYYHDKRYQFTWSYPSDPVELVVAGEGPSSVSLLPAPYPDGPSGAGHVQRGKQEQGPPESVGLEHRTPPGGRASSSGWGGVHTNCPSKSSLIFIPVHAPDRGVSVTMGSSESGSALSPGPSRGDARLRGRDRITAGFPSKGGAAAAGGLRPREAGSLPPGGAAEQGPFPGGCSTSFPCSRDTQRSWGSGAAQPAPAPALNSLPTSPDN
uniref:Ig-like domain-containing protein n=1 Tax=Gopherus evgoodei TaxID=1825980 RepID=A0A8C4WU61_9SAUR